MAMPFASDPATSMFPPADWVPVDNSIQCNKTYGLEPQYGWALTNYGGMVPKRDFYKTSNIIFSNGVLDPWHAGGIYEEQVSNRTLALYIPHSAHHLDLRLPNEADPSTVTAARDTESLTIAKWIDEYQGTNFQAQIKAGLTESTEPKTGAWKSLTKVQSPSIASKFLQ